MAFYIAFGASFGLSTYVGWHLAGHFINKRNKQ